MKTNYPYRATAMKPIDPMKCCNNSGGEYASHAVMDMKTRAPSKPKSTGAKPAMMHGPYGGKAPQS